MNVIYEYSLLGDLGRENTSNTAALYFIGAMMLLGGLVNLIWEIRAEGGPEFVSMVLPIITTLGGISFLIAASRSKNVQSNTVKYSIQISDEKIITKHGTDNKAKEMLTSEIIKIDFNSKDIHIHGENNSEIVVDLGLISPEKKKNELTQILESILK